MKYNAGGNTPRTIDPTLTRKRGSLSHPGSLLIAGVAIIFFAYMFGALPQLDTYFNSLTTAISGQRAAAMTIWELAPYVGAGVVGLILLVWLWGKMSDAMKLSSKRSMVAGRPSLSNAQFVAIAAKHAVSAKVAHQTYKTLHADYGSHMKVDLNDDLRRDLHWKETHVLDMMTELARHCDRKKNFKAEPASIRTVLDLLLYLESCPKFSLTESSVHRRRAAKDPAQHSGMRRALDGVTRMLKPAHKRSDVIKAMQAKPAAPAPVAYAKPAETTSPAAPVQAAPAQAAPHQEKKPALSFIRPRRYPPSVDNTPGAQI